MIQTIQYEQHKNKKTLIHTNSSQSHSNSSLLNHKALSIHNNKFVSLNRIFTYFHFYQHFLQSKFIPYHPSNLTSYQHTQIKLFLSQNQSKAFHQFIAQKNQNYSQQLNKKTIKFLQSYQQFYQNKLQSKLLSSGRFKKAKNFTAELLIDEIQPTKHYEIVKLGVQLLQYRTQILILNHLQKNTLTANSQASNSGSFGLIYFINVLNQNLSVKIIPLSQKQSIHYDSKDYKLKTQTLSKAIKQFFFLLLFSELQIGPKVKNIGGFDLIVNSQQIQFATQICQEPKLEDQTLFIQQVTQNLFQMHMVKVVHRDIKPSNIMYSPIFKKYVFIDFGCSEGLKENLGQRKLTRFTGATAYCSQQMLTLLSMKNGYVDLYFNDIFALSKSLDLQTIKSQDQFEIQIIKDSQFYVYKMKFYLYQGKYDEFYEMRNYVTSKYCDEIQDIQIKLIEFLKDIKITTKLRQFYWTQIDENVRQMEQFHNINSLMKNHSSDLISQISIFPIKQNNFEEFSVMYRILKVQYGHYTKQQKQIESILVSKDKINIYLAELELKIENGDYLLMGECEVVKANLIVVFYATFAQNKYNASIQDKVKACTLINHITQKNNQMHKKQQQLLQFCKSQRLFQMILFYRTYFTRVWKKAPQKYSDKSALNTLITLFLLGSPMNFWNLTKNLNKQQKQLILPKNNQIKYKYQTYKDKNILKNKQTKIKTDWRTKLNKICLFWQFELVLIVFQNTYVPQKISQFNAAIQHQIQQQVFQMKDILFFGNQKKVFEVNKIFYQQLIGKYKNFNEICFDSLLKELKCKQIKELQKISIEVKKWSSLLQILLYCYVFTYSSNCSVQMLLNLNSEMIFSHWQNNNILPYAICLFLYRGTNFEMQSKIIQKIDETINCKQIALRYCLFRKLRLALERLDWKQIQEITQFIKRQIVPQRFQIVSNSILISIIRIIKKFIQEYVKSLSIISSQFIKLLQECFDLVKLAWDVGLNYTYIPSTQKIKETPYNKINHQFIQQTIKEDQLYSFFHSYLTTLNTIYYNVFHSHKSSKYQTLISQNYLQFFQVSKKQKTLSFTYEWLEIIKQNQKVKSIIKQNRLLLILLVNSYLEDRKTIMEIQKGQQMFNQLFQQINPQHFFIPSDTVNFPSFQVAFDYLQIKLIQTKYDSIFCQKMIEMYQVCVQKNCFSLVYEKQGLLRFIFNSFIYAQRPYQEIRQYLDNLSKSITLLPKKSIVKIFLNQLERWFFCQCETCFPRRPQNWKSQLFTQYLYQTMHLCNAAQNPYMGMVYFFSMNNKILRPEVIQKFIRYILKCVNFLIPTARNKIMTRMHFYVQVGFHFSDKQNIFVGKNKDILVRFPIQQRKESYHRRILRSYFMNKKYEQTSVYTSQVIAEKRLIKEFYFYDYKYPKLIRQIYKRKLIRFHEVKQSYKRDMIVEKILQSQHYQYFQSVRKSKKS